MTRLTEDTTLDVIEQLIAEGGAHRDEQLMLLETQTRRDQDPSEVRQSLQAIDEALATLRCRQSYLQAMQVKP